MRLHLLLLFALFNSNPLISQICSPALDLTFGTAGFTIGSVTTASNFAPYSTKMLIQADNKIIQVGRLAEANNHFGLVRYQSNGKFDSSFGVNGKVFTVLGTGGSDANTATLQPDGKIIVAGMSYNVGGQADFALARYKVNGTLDSSFGTNGIVVSNIGSTYEYISGLALQADDKIIAVGSSADTSSFSAFATVRYHANGSIDSSFGTQGKVISHLGPFIGFIGTTYYGVYSYENANAVLIQPDGKILVLGTSYVLNGCYDYYGYVYCNPAAGIIRYNVNGTVDNSFGNGGKVIDSVNLYYPSSAVLLPDGKIMVTGVGGSSGSGNDLRVLRFNADGSRDNGFGSNGVGLITASNDYANSRSIFLQPDGRILLGGNNGNNNSNNFLVARLKSNGQRDSSFYSNGLASFHLGQHGSNDGVYSVSLHEDKILVSGYSQFYSNQITQNNHRLLLLRLLDSSASITPVVSPAGPLASCQGTPIILRSNETGIYQWYYNGGVMPGATESTLSVSVSGNYSVGVTNLNGCGVSAPVSVTVYSNPPVPPLSYSGTPYQFSTTPGYAQYTWYFNNSVITGATSNTYTPTQAGNYSVKVTDPNNCSTTSSIYNLIVLSTTDLQVGGASLRFYPSPAYGQLNIDVQQASGKKLTAELYDLGGKLLHTQLLNRNHNEIPLKSLQAAVYLLVVSDGRVKEVRKIVVIN